MKITLYTNFKRTDFACKCCGKNLIHDDLIIRLQALRSVLKTPLIVSSGYRCPKHNASAAVGGRPYSMHLKGLAVDLKTTLPQIRPIMEVAPILFNGIGLYAPGHKIHLDIRQQPRLWIG